MSESNPHTGTGHYRCDQCGEVFPWTEHKGKDAWDAIEAHECAAAELTARTW